VAILTCYQQNSEILVTCSCTAADEDFGGKQGVNIKILMFHFQTTWHGKIIS